MLPTEAFPWMKMDKLITRGLLESGRGRIRTHRRLREAVKKNHRQEARGKRKQQEVKKVTVVQSLWLWMVASKEKRARLAAPVGPR